MAFSLPPFHLAIEVRDMHEARDFYATKMNFPEGRSSKQWIDFNMFGHQLVTHLNPLIGKHGKIPAIVNSVDGHDVPVPHFGVVLDLDNWHVLAERVTNFVDEFVIEPHIRFKGEAGEQATMFFSDPSGNSLEFKAFRDVEANLFAR